MESKNPLFPYSLSPQETIDRGNKQKKREIKYRKNETKYNNGITHQEFTDAGIPLRVNGNKLGLAKREKLFMQEFLKKKEPENG